MENFIVSARKYRPVTFDAVIGQATITHTLKNAIKNKHLAQAFLFCGPRGVGKTTCARILAKAINCENPGNNIDPCDHCPSCLSFNTSHSFNIHELDAASNNSVDDIRLLTEQVRFAPQAGKYKVYIIDEVHMLSQSAFNAFLKTLEEPPPHAIFILATTEKFKIIPTILSRCQIYDFHRIRVDDIAAHLKYVAEKENVKAEPDGLHIIAQKADGSLRDALSIFDQLVSFSGNDITYKTVIDNLNILDYDYYFKITDAILLQDTGTALVILNEIIDNGFDIRNFINGMGTHFRDLLVIKDKQTIQLLEVSANIKNRYGEQAARCTAGFLLKGLNLVNQADYQYNLQSNQRLLTEILLLNLSSIRNSTQSAETGFPADKAVSKNFAAESGTDIKKNNEPEIAPAVTPVIPEKPYVQTMEASVPSTANEPILKAAGKILAKTISIGAFLKKGQSKGAAETAPGVTNGKPPAIIENNVFPEEALVNAWGEYSESIRKKGRMSLYTSLTKRNPVKTGDSVVEFTVDYRIQADEIAIEKNEILDFLKNRLHNSAIRLNVVINQAGSVEKKPYTVQERYKKMAEKNPYLEKLRQRLQLEIE